MYTWLTLIVQVANAPIQKDAKNMKISETVSNGYSSESTQRELSNEYQHDRVWKITSALEELTICVQSIN